MDNRSFDASVIVPNIAMICLVAIGLLSTPTPLNTRRPKDPAPAASSAQSSQSPARLWEDPFAVAPAKNPGVTLREPVENFARQWTQDLAASRELLQSSASATTRPRVLLLPVLLRGGDYADDHEFRLRTRYAVLSALARAQYIPNTPDRIGFVRTPDQPCHTVPYDFFVTRNLLADEVARAGHTGPYLMPAPAAPDSTHLVFHNAYDAVIVLWLNEATLLEQEQSPLAAVEKLAAQLTRSGDGVPSGSDAFDLGGTVHLGLKVVGPTSSNALLSMLGHAQSPPGNLTLGKDEKRLLFSPRATIAPEVLQLSTWRKPGDLGADNAFPGWIWQRTVATDDVIVKALLGELRQRNVSPEKTANNLVLVAEWDGVYSRALARTIAVQLARKARGTGHAPSLADWLETPANLYEFSYTRGIDGTGAETSEKKNAKPAANSNQGQTTQAAASDEREKANGPSQYDYLRRLEEDLEKLDRHLRQSGQGKITAIGVLGSDVYDRLLVMRALRQRFGDAVFFTTDLDAAMLDPAEREWTRNLIVGSSFDLSANRVLQDRIPPFRDSYQTALFLTTLQALNLTRVKGVPFDCDGTRITARLNELGRNAMHSLPTAETPSTHHPDRLAASNGRWSPRAVGFLILCGLVALLFWQAGLAGNLRHPRPKGSVDDARPPRPRWMTLLPWQGWQGLFALAWISATVGLLCQINPCVIALKNIPGAMQHGVVAALAAAVAGTTLFTYFWTFERINRWLGDKPIEPGPGGGLMRMTWGFAALVIGAGIYLLVARVHQAITLPEEEIFSWFDGVSTWPTEAARFITMLLAVSFLIRAQDRLHATHRRISDTPVLSRGSLGAKLLDPRKLPPPGGLGQTLRDIFLIPRPPRDNAASPKETDLWAAYLVSSGSRNRFWRVLFMASLYVVFWIQLCLIYEFPAVPTRGVNCFALDKGILGAAVAAYVFLLFYVFDATLLVACLVRDLRQTIGKPSELPENRTLHLINDLCEPVSRLIYLPFTILFLMIVARNALFDNWSWPPLLVGIFATGLLVIVIAAAGLQYHARQAKAASLDAIDDLLLEAGQSANESRTRMLQEERRQAAAFSGVVFQTWLANPIYRALLIPLGGLGSIQLLEKFLMAF